MTSLRSAELYARPLQLGAAMPPASPVAPVVENIPVPAESFLSISLGLAAAGFHVFPLIEGSKLPLIDGWQNRATRDPDQIRRWWVDPVMGEEQAYNIGICTTRFGDDQALVVVDVDNKGTKRGDASLLQLELKGHEFPATLTQTTPTGGRHLVYWTETPVKQGVDVLGAGLDIRSKGGYIVAAGSTLDGRPYTANDLPVAKAPAWLVAKCGIAKDKPDAPSPMPGIDQDRAEKWAEEYLSQMQPVPEGQRNNTLNTTATILRSHGLCFERALPLLVSQFPASMDRDEMERTVRSVYSSTKIHEGAHAPEIEFTKGEVAPAQAQAGKPARRGLHFEMFNTVKPDLTSVSLVAKYLDPGAMSVIYGESNTGKTFFAMDIAFHVARRLSWMGRKVHGGAVVYVAAEGGSAVKKRVAAFRKHHKLEAADVPFALVPCPVDLLDPKADTQALIDLIVEVARQTSAPVVLVVIDTLARAIAGGNENASEDMGAFVRNVDRVRSATGAHTMIVHHSGKNKAAGARGHSSLRAATDTEIEIDQQIATATKQRDLEQGAPIAFDLKQVTIGIDADGELVTSCVVIPRSLTAAPADRPELPPDSNAANLLGVVRKLIRDEGKTAPSAFRLDPNIQVVTLKRVREAFKAGHLRDLDDEAKRKAILRARDTLQRAGYIQIIKEYLWLTQ